MTFSATLPIPPSVNTMFPTGKSGRRFASKKYTEWKALAEKCFQTHNRLTAPMLGRLSVTYSYCFADKRVRDIANFEKAISDFLVTQKVIEDDSQIDEMRLVRLANGLRGYVFVEVGSITVEKFPGDGGLG